MKCTTQFQLKALSAAVLGAVGTLGTLAAAPALALQPSDFDGTTKQIWISGASAQNAGLIAYYREACKPGTMDVYNAASNNLMIFCQSDSADIPGLPDGTKIVVYKNSVGGSGNGVTPVFANTNLTFLSMPQLQGAGLAAGCSPTVSTITTGSLPAYNNYSCTLANLLVQTPPTAGLSDVEPELLDPSIDVNQLTVKGVNGVIFGVPVSRNLYNALQGAQGLTVGDESEANMPSLTKEQIASLISNQVTSWTRLANASTGASLNNTVSNAVFIANRQTTSGTRFMSGIYFLSASCSKVGVQGFPAANDTTACGAVAGTVGRFFEGSGGGDVRNCLNTHNSAGRWAIGLLSTEDTAAASNGWRFIKINGVAPSLKNVINTKYDFYSEQTLQYRNASNVNGPVPDPDQQAILDGLTGSTGFGKAATVSAVDSTINHLFPAFGNAGVVALNTISGNAPSTPLSAGGSIPAATALSNPVIPFTKTLAGSKPNNCQPPLINAKSTAAGG